MYTKREIKMMVKGFFPSRCGKEDNRTSNREIITGLGDIKNRYQRRGNFKGEHRNKGGIMKIIGTTRFVSRVQIIPVKTVWDKKRMGYIEIPSKKILHWDKV